MWFHRLAGRHYITGRTGRRDWYANLLAHPRFSIRFTESEDVGIDAVARAITKPLHRREILNTLFEAEGGFIHGGLDEWMPTSPVVEFKCHA